MRGRKDKKRDNGRGPRALRHPASAAFHRWLREIGELHDRKQQDYGREGDPFSNVRAAEEWGVPGWKYAMMRSQEKMRRLQTMAKKGRLANERAEDSFRDIAVYCGIAEVLFTEFMRRERLGRRKK